MAETGVKLFDPPSSIFPAIIRRQNALKDLKESIVFCDSP